MDQIEVNKWELDLTKNVCKFWDKIKISNELIKTNGFSVFYSPVYFKPKLLIIGINPGGNFIRDGIIFDPNEVVNNLPTKHDYFLNTENDYRLAKCMRELFDFNISVLQNSVKINFYYFRTPSETVLREQKEFSDINEFCTKQTLNIINTLKPKKIITEGLGVSKMISRLLNINGSEPIIESRYNKYTLLQRSFNDKIELIGLRHPSGSRPRHIFNDNKTIIMDELKKSFLT